MMKMINYGGRVPRLGELAQQAERLHRTQQAGGSIPPFSTNVSRGDES